MQLFERRRGIKSTATFVITIACLSTPWGFPLAHGAPVVNGDLRSNQNSSNPSDSAAKPPQDDEMRDDGPLGALLGTARRVAEQASRAAGGSADDSVVQDVIEATADGVRAGLAATDESLPPLDNKVAKEFGDKFRDSLLSSHKRITDRKTISLVMPLWEELVQASKTPPNSVTVTLLEDPEINAFAFVGRNIVVNRGFITFATECTKTRDVIRFALAHELGHIVCGHTDTLFRRMVAVDKIVPGTSVGPAIIETLIKKTPINQAAEREADCFARKIHVENGWSLEGGKEFLTRVQSMTGRPTSGGAMESLFSSHPDEKRRLELLESGAGCDR